MNILYLTLKKEPFIEVLAGRKKEEYREDKEFWSKRFEGNEKAFTHVLFRNGYSANAPEILIECKGIQLKYWEYKDGTEDFIWVIKLGKMVHSKNVNSSYEEIKQIKPAPQVKPICREVFNAEKKGKQKKTKVKIE